MSEAAATTGSTRRELFEDDHEAFRESFRTFLEREVVADYPAWRSEGIPRKLFGRLAEHQFVAAAVPEEHDGAGIDDFRFGAVILEEAMRANAAGLALQLLALNEICVPLLVKHTGDARREEWLSGMAAGELVAALAAPAQPLSAPLSARRREGVLIVDGSADGVVNGCAAGIVLAVVSLEGDRGPALVVVEAGAPGLSRAPAPELVGPRGCDRADLRFEGVEIPADAVVGGAEIERALAERALAEQQGLALMATAGARRALGETLDYVHERRAFGRPIAEFENTRFALAAVAAEIEATQAFVDACMSELVAGRLTPLRAAAAKLQASEAFGRAVDAGLQLHGGYGYMLEYPIAHTYADARYLRLHGGSSEQMKAIIADAIGL